MKGDYYQWMEQPNNRFEMVSEPPDFLIRKKRFPKGDQRKWYELRNNHTGEILAADHDYAPLQIRAEQIDL